MGWANDMNDFERTEMDDKTEDTIASMSIFETELKRLMVANVELRSIIDELRNRLIPVRNVDVGIRVKDNYDEVAKDPLSHSFAVDSLIEVRDYSTVTHQMVALLISELEI